MDPDKRPGDHLCDKAVSWGYQDDVHDELLMALLFYVCGAVVTNERERRRLKRHPDACRDLSEFN